MRTWAEANCVCTTCSIWTAVASSSMYSAICAIVEMLATTCFHSPDMKSFVMAGFMSSSTRGIWSTWAAHRQTRSTTSLPKEKSSSTSAVSSSSAIHTWTSSSSSTMNWTAVSRACSMYPGILHIIFGLLCMNVAIASRADLRASVHAWDLAMTHRTGRRLAMPSALRKSTISELSVSVCRTASTCFGSPTSASCFSAEVSSGLSPTKGSRSALFSMSSMSLQSSWAVVARTSAAGSARPRCRTWHVWPELATRIFHMELVISFATHRQSARTPPSLLPSQITLMSAGRRSGHSCAWLGRWSPATLMSWFPRLWTQSATFRRTGGWGSCSSRARSLVRTSACPGSPSSDQTESASAALSRHCLRSTAPCSRTGCSTWRSWRTPRRAATVVPGCPFLSPA
mmetsp:Transcript_20502/g.57411  ORF Transcript_20502/g.57411 Transcript_20502/m.57411 type:complete len:399 (-) Transcript_20502:149-1345(-)